MKRHSAHSTHSRAGTAMIVAVICLTLLAAITVSLVRLALASQQQVVREGWRLQSEWLAESALNRAIVRINDGEDGGTDEWAPDFTSPAGARGRVTIGSDADPEDETRLTITVTADFPDHPTHRVRTTRSRTITRSNDDSASAEDIE